MASAGIAKRKQFRQPFVNLYIISIIIFYDYSDYYYVFYNVVFWFVDFVVFDQLFTTL